MAKLSKFYKVTNQIMIEYVADLYLATSTPSTTNTTYTTYTGKDELAYMVSNLSNWTTQSDVFKCAESFIKFPDESSSEYTFLGYNKIDDILYNTSLVSSNMNSLTNAHTTTSGNMYFDKIKIHLIYGFLFDNLAGITLLIKTNARCLMPILEITSHTLSHLVFDDYGYPVFKSYTINSTQVSAAEAVEPLRYNEKEFTLLDIFIPKEALLYIVKYHTVPIYLNSVFYDRYIEIDVPSAYYLSLLTAGIFTVENAYGCNLSDIIIRYRNKNGDVEVDTRTEEYCYPVYYAKLPTADNPRKLTYVIDPDPTLIVNFATVSEENVTSTNTSGSIFYASTFYQDPINLIALKYKSNSDYFNIRLYEDQETNEIIYYPTYGDTDNSLPLNYAIFYLIETGAIPLITEAFYDTMYLLEDFYETYGENAFKWIIYNEMTVTYNYADGITQLNASDPITATTSRYFTNIVDYSNRSDDNTEFWKNTFVPRIPERQGKYCKSILIAYTCRLVNRVTSVEAIRRGTLTISDPTRYVTRLVSINNVVTYKIVNLILKQEIRQLGTTKESKDKLVRSYYDATNIVVKDMGTNNLYTLGLMTLRLKHTSSNYVFRLFTLNDDNVRIPYDLTGPFRYKLVFPTTGGSKISISPNTDNTTLNMGIGQLVFYITESQVKLIMNVGSSDRYFAIMSDTEDSDTTESTLYEGKVSYYS